MQQNKLKILFINSSSNSGSTLLEALLSTQSGVSTVGEVGAFGKSLKKNEQCSCGELLTSCRIWSKLDEDILKLNYQDDLGVFLRTSSFASRWYLFFYMVIFCRIDKLEERMLQYAINTKRTFLNYIELQENDTGETIKLIIDSTKSHWRVQWLQASGLFDVSVIHLVKDSRAYVHSMDKTYTIRKPTSKYATKSAFKLAYRWLATNLSILILHRSSFKNSSRMLIRYDELASDYISTIKNICEWLDVPFDADQAKSFRENKDHAISGNPMRTESRPVQLDTEWHSALKPVRSWIVWSVTWPLAIYFGFRRSYKKLG